MVFNHETDDSTREVKRRDPKTEPCDTSIRGWGQKRNQQKILRGKKVVTQECDVLEAK